MGNINDWIATETPDLPVLFLAHTTIWQNLEEITRSGRIKANSPFPPKNSVKENPYNGISDTLYLFYGMPFYVVSLEGAMSMATIGNLPVGMLFKPTVLKKITRMYPFDTGGYFRGFFDSAISLKHSDIRDYEVTSNGGGEVQRLVKRYFGNNENYLRGHSNFKGMLASSKEDVLVKLHQIKTIHEVDNRVNSIELHCPEEIELKDNIEAIILPKTTYKYNKHLLNDIEKHCKILTYYENDRYDPAKLCHSIMTIADKYYENNSN